MPLTCGLADEAQPAAAGNVLCNALYKGSSVQLFAGGTIDPLHTLDGAAVDHTFDLAGIASPLSRGDLLLTDGGRFDWVDLDTGSFQIDMYPPVEFMTDKQVTVAMSAYRGLGGVAECAGSQLPLMLPLQGMLLGGTVFYCFEVQGDILIVTWNSTQGATPTECGRIREKGRFMLVLYDGKQLQTAGDPFQYVYTVTKGAGGAWGITCTARWYQSIFPADVENENWDRYLFLASAAALWGNVSRCVVGTSSPAHVGPFTTGLQLTFSVDVSRQAVHGSDVLFPHFSPQSMGPLQGAVNASQILKVTASDAPGMCVLEKVLATPTVIGDGSATLATTSISSLLALGIASGYGGRNLPVIRQQINDMSGQFAPLTVAAAVNAAMTCIVAAYGANVFTLKVKFLKATNAVRLTIRALVSVVEAVVVSIAAIVAMWALHTDGKACRPVQWVDNQNGQSIDYMQCNHYISTAATICGSADYLLVQWIVLGVGMLLATMLIMHRWHFARGGSVCDWVEIVTEEEHAAQKGDEKV